MRITIFAAGSRGDIQPCVVLSKGLQAAGHQVLLAAPQDFADFARQHGVNFHPLRGDVQQLMASDTGRQFMDSGGANPLRAIRAIRTLLAPVVTQMVEDAYAACREAEALICLGVLSAFGQTIAEALRLPIIHIEPTPLLPTRAFAAPSWPIQRSLGGLHNYLSGVAMLETIWLWYRPFVDAFRKRLGLPAYGPVQLYRALQSTPLLGMYSPTIIPHPADWPSSVHVTGYLLLDTQPDWQPAPELERFLAAGEPPVYIGFGSMGGSNPQQLAELILAALAQSGQRGLLLTGWGGLRAGSTPDSVFVLDAAPHSWLFGRVAAVVHHGGAGTTAEGLRAGVPTVVLPFLFDQPFWGARIHALGLGPAPIPQKKLTAERLARAITTAVTDANLRQRAGQAGAAIRAEDGVGKAVNAIERILGAPTPPKRKAA
jgi:sterol 3beta-glucosyltransferase